MIYRSTLMSLPLLIALPGVASSQAAYTSQEIENFFSGGMNCPEGQACVAKKQTRAVCIGTASSCNDQDTAEAVDPGAFDMLITFELGSDRLSPVAKENLAEFAKALTSDTLRAAEFNIDGHTDARGSDTYNRSLSERRAAAVVEFLESLGVSSDRLAPAGFGESKPRVSDPFAAINRRVEARLKIR